mmetsp:Transcript_70936/g.148392  ORF Transcript_70936/g.148392 Transcript_70936/m.148392 type:complete len:142 (-) Transcript_70936:120-545(-)
MTHLCRAAAAALARQAVATVWATAATLAGRAMAGLAWAAGPALARQAVTLLAWAAAAALAGLTVALAQVGHGFGAADAATAWTVHGRCSRRRASSTAARLAMNAREVGGEADGRSHPAARGASHRSHCHLAKSEHLDVSEM